MARLADLTVSLQREQHTDARTRERAKHFNLSARCVASMFLHYLGPLEVGPFRKIIIEVRPSPDLQEQDEMIDVLRVGAKLDVDAYFAAPAHEQKRAILTLLVERLSWLFAARGWPAGPLDTARHECLERDLRFVFEHRRPRTSPDSRYSGQVEVEHGQVVAVVRVRIRKRPGMEVVVDHELFRTEPHEFRFGPLLGRTNWESPSTFALWSRDGRRSWNVEVSQCPE